MRLISASFEILRPLNIHDGVDLLRFIERMARVSHRSEERQTLDSWEKFLAFVVLQHGDWSVVEHAHATVLFRVNRGVTHELVRHRMFSFTQESTRFVNGRKSYPNGLEFILPVDAHLAPDPRLTGDGPNSLDECLEDAERSYLKLLDDGIRPQQARAVLPNCLAATIAVTGNLRAWRHLLLMRTTRETHPDFKQVTVPLLAELRARVPLLFDDITPEESQAQSLRRPR